MENESEIAADDWVILQGMKPSGYASELLQLVSSLGSRPSSETFAQTAMAKVPAVEARIRSIIDPHSRRGPVALSLLAKLGGFFAALVCAMVLLTVCLVNPSSAEPPPPPGCLPNSN
jgi:hypothetical protein